MMCAGAWEFFISCDRGVFLNSIINLEIVLNLEKDEKSPLGRLFDEEQSCVVSNLPILFI